MNRSVHDPTRIQEAADFLGDLYVRVQTGEIESHLEPSFAAQPSVLATFQPIFAPEHLPELTEAEFRSFLTFKNNQHWSGLHRLGPRICEDMDELRQALSVLLDESRPIAERYDYALDRVHGMGRAIATAILLVVYPDKYGVWNTTAEAGIKALELWPAFARGGPEGERYGKINALLVALAHGAGVDLWTLDALWWYALAAKDQSEGVEPDAVGRAAITTPVEAEVFASQYFGLERHLQDFLWDNWAQTDLAEWKRYTEPGNDRAGYEHPCDVGRIDILAQHPQNGDWLVVELKRGQTSDETVGQVLRYMGWVKRHLAEDGETVHGLIVAQTGDDRIHYALSMVENVRFQVYKVQFTLQAAPQPEGMAQ